MVGVGVGVGEISDGEVRERGEYRKKKRKKKEESRKKGRLRRGIVKWELG